MELKTCSNNCKNLDTIIDDGTPDIRCTENVKKWNEVLIKSLECDFYKKVDELPNES